MTESPTPVSGDAMELVERLRRMARVGGHGLEKLVAEAADEIERLQRIERNRDMWKAQCERQAERLRSQGGAPEGWAHVPAIGTYVEADHPITCINPTKAFEVRFVNSVRGHWLVRGDNTCWFDVNSVMPATRENAIAAEEAAMLSAAPQPPVSQSVQRDAGALSAERASVIEILEARATKLKEEAEAANTNDRCYKLLFAADELKRTVTAIRDLGKQTGGADAG